MVVGGVNIRNSKFSHFTHFIELLAWPSSNKGTIPNLGIFSRTWIALNITSQIHWSQISQLGKHWKHITRDSNKMSKFNATKYIASKKKSSHLTGKWQTSHPKQQKIDYDLNYFEWLGKLFKFVDAIYLFSIFLLLACVELKVREKFYVNYAWYRCRWK